MQPGCNDLIDNYDVVLPIRSAAAAVNSTLFMVTYGSAPDGVVLDIPPPSSALSYDGSNVPHAGLTAHLRNIGTSTFGTWRTSMPSLRMSAFGDKADICDAHSHVCF